MTIIVLAVLFGLEFNPRLLVETRFFPVQVDLLCIFTQLLHSRVFGIGSLKI